MVSSTAQLHGQSAATIARISDIQAIPMLDFDDELIRKFPNLYVLPDDPLVRAEAERRFDILQGERERLRLLFRHLATARQAAKKDFGVDASDARVREAGWHALQEYYAWNYRLTPATYDRDRRLFLDALKAADESVDEILREYFPLRFRQCLATLDLVASQHDPIELFRLCAEPGDDLMSRLKRFEARRKFTVGLSEFELRLFQAEPDIVEQDMAFFVEILERHFFAPGHIEQVTIVAERDPRNEMRISEHRILPRDSREARHSIPSENLDVLPIDLRFVMVNGREVPIFFLSRVKRHPTQKMLRKRERHLNIGDRLGVTFGFFCEKDLLETIPYLRHQVVRQPGTVWGQVSNLSRAGVLDKTNPHSSPEYQATKWNWMWMGSPMELRFMLYRDWRNELVSHGPENHSLYKLTQLLEDLAGIVFPKTLYSIDWSSPDIHREMTKFIRSKY
ncbi:hypothetical protein HZC53_01790 [Candidatus Uhrbacteria bacterium]|nr:hypothetical protein [Candidatus Uhrbacteria bacterium]